MHNQANKEVETLGPLGKRNASLTGWRAVACLLVLFAHTGFTLGYSPVFLWGFCGVHCFFVLSGFLLFAPFCRSILDQKPLPSISNFYARRFIRIYPPYLVALIVFSVLRLLSNDNPPTITSFLLHASFAFNFASEKEFFAINVIFWTLAIEAQFYVIMPAIVAMVRFGNKLNSHASVAIIIAVFICIGVTSRTLEFITTQGNTVEALPTVRFRFVSSYLDLFAMGMAASALDFWTRHSRLLSSRYVLTGIAVLGFVLLLVANYWCTVVSPGEWAKSNDQLFTQLFAPAICLSLAMILYSVARGDLLFSGFLSNKYTVWVGEVSYSVYLYHILVQLAMFRLLPLHNVESYYIRTLIWGLVSLGPTLVLAFVMHRFIEMPCLRLAGTFHAKRETATSN